MSGPIIAVTGAINWDINLYVPKIASPGEEAVVERIERVPGGKGANVAVAISRILGKGKSAIIGGIGNDEIGRNHIHIFEEEGVDTRWLLRFEEVESGQAYILIDEEGENQINTYFGANASLKREHVEGMKELFNTVRCLVLMDAPIEFTEGLLSLAKGVLKLWAPGVRVLKDRASVLSLLKYMSYLILNEHELKDLTRTTDIFKAYDDLRALNPNLKVIVTQGARGASLLTPEVTHSVEGIDLKRLGLKVVNTVGCGDAFIGALASYLILGFSEESALTMANLAGAIKATRYETRGSPTKAELERYYRMYFG